MAMIKESRLENHFDRLSKAQLLWMVTDLYKKRELVSLILECPYEQIEKAYKASTYNKLEIVRD